MSTARTKVSVTTIHGERIEVEASHDGESYATAQGILDAATKKVVEILNTLHQKEKTFGQ